MYEKILVALENSRTDEALVPHVSELARRFGSELLLVHVADGWAARHFDDLKLAESDEMKSDRAYLESIATRLRSGGLVVTTELALGHPPTEIVRTAEARGCKLIALTSHGHKLIADVLLGSTIDKVRHNTSIPLLVVRAGFLRLRRFRRFAHWIEAEDPLGDVAHDLFRNVARGAVFGGGARRLARHKEVIQFGVRLEGRVRSVGQPRLPLVGSPSSRPGNRVSPEE